MMKMQRILGKGVFHMTKEEILEKSRQSGEGVYDEREQQIVNRSYGIGGAVSMLIAMLLMIVNEIADGPEVVRHAIWTVYWCNQTFLYGHQAIKLKKRAYWFTTVLFGFAAVMSCWGYLKLTLGW